jgi:hypothetical protein
MQREHGPRQERAPSEVGKGGIGWELAEAGIMKDMACGEGGSTIFLGDALGLGIAVSMGSLAIDWCWVLHQGNILPGGWLCLRGLWFGSGRRGMGGAGQVRGQLVWYFVESRPCCICSAGSASLGCPDRTQIGPCCMLASAIGAEVAWGRLMSGAASSVMLLGAKATVSPTFVRLGSVPVSLAFVALGHSAVLNEKLTVSELPTM